MAWLGTWANRKRIDLDKALIGANLSNVPVSINLSALGNVGAENLSEIFGELTYNLTGDDFTADNGDAPNIDLWAATESANTTVEIDANELRIDTDSAVLSSSNIRSKFKLASGDFDIQVDWKFSNDPGSSGNTEILFEARIDIDNRMKVFYHPQANEWSSKRFIGGISTQADFTEIILGSTWRKLRLVRVGNDWTSYRYTSSQTWVAMQSSQAIGSGEVNIFLMNNTYVACTINTHFDNFIINSGTVVWPLGVPSPKRIAFTTDNGTTQLTAEVAFWDTANERALLFVKMDLVADTTKTLYFYFDKLQPDNTVYVGAPGTAIAESLWSSNGDRIFHLNEDYENLITNGNFSDGENDWSYASGIIHSIIGGQQFIDRNGQGYVDHAYQYFPTVIGVTYRWTCWVQLVTDTGVIVIDDAIKATITTANDTAYFTGTFVATKTSTKFAVRASAAIEAEVTFDNVYIVKDRLFVESAGVADGAYTRWYVADPQADVLGAKGVDLLNDEIMFPSITTGSAHSVLFVTKRPLTQSEHVLSGTIPGTRIYLAGLDQVILQTVSGAVSMDHGITDSDDHVFVLTKNGTSIKLYVDGNFVDSGTGYNETNQYHNIGGKDYVSAVEYLVAPIGELWILDAEMSADWVEVISKALLGDLTSWYSGEGGIAVLGHDVIHSALFGGLVVR